MAELINETGPDCVGFNFRRLTRIITGLYDTSLKEAGITTTQFSLLAMISRHEPVKVTELAEILAMDRTTVTRTINLMEKHNYLEIKSGYDRRTKIITISSKGWEKFAEAYPLWEKVQSKITNLFGEDKWRLLKSDLSGLETTISQI